MSLIKSPAFMLAVFGAVAVYALLMMASCDGYGYAGYGGYDRSASFWYMGGVRTHHNRSVRAGSRGGSSLRGGGPHAGK